MEADVDVGLRVLFENARFGVAIFDDALRFIAVNEAMARINLTPRELQLGRRFDELFDPVEAAEAIARLRGVIESGVAERGVKVGTPEGFSPSRTFECDYEPLTLTDGRRGVLAIVTETTEETKTLARLAESEAKLRHVLDCTLAHVAVLDREGRLMLANAPALTEAQIEPSDVAGKLYEDTYWWSYDADAQARMRDSLDRAAAGETVRRRDRIRISPTRHREVLLQIAPVRSLSGEVSLLVPSLVDVTDEVEAKERQSLLAAELNHRVKNILAIVRALVTHTARRAPTKEALAQSLEGRIGAMARTVALLNRNDWDGFGIGDVHYEQLNQNWGDRVAISGPNLRLSPKAALAFSLLLYEFMSNASKYGALSLQTGRVSATWTIDDATLIWRWREIGGPTATAPQEQGFGSVLVRNIAEGDLSGVLVTDYPPEGFIAELRAPVASLMAARPSGGPPERSGAAGAHVLLAEASAIVALDHMSVLEALGARVAGPATTTAEVIAMIAADPPRIAVLGARLAEPEVLAAIEQAGCGVVLLGGAGPAPPRGVRLMKPYSDADLAVALETVAALVD